MTETKPKEVSPGSKARFGWNWQGWLQPNDSISLYTVTPTAGLTVVGPVALENDVVTAVLLVDGAALAGDKLSALCTITTANGYVDKRTIHMKVAIR